MYRSADLTPIDSQGAPARRFVVSNREIFDLRRELGNFHVHARQFIAFILVRNAPLSGLLADNQRPLIGIWYGEDGVAAGGPGGSPQPRGRPGYGGSGLLFSSSPH